MSLETQLKEIVETLNNSLTDVKLVDSKSYGWKSGNKRLRKNIQTARTALKDLRGSSIEAEK